MRTVPLFSTERNITATYQTKRITIVHDQPLLLSDAYPDGFRKTVAKNLRRRDITLVLNDSIPSEEISNGRTITTEKGRLLVADLVVCFSSLGGRSQLSPNLFL